MLRRLYDWVMGLAASRHAQIALFVVAFAESSFFPIPPDVMLAPMVLARRELAWRYAAICTFASVLGGMLGYAIGYYLQDVAMGLMSLTGHAGGLAEFQCWYQKFGVWVILIKGLTPIPYKLVTIASGLAQFSFPVFVAASIATRGLRFFLVAWVVRKFGPAMMPVIERRLGMVAVGLILLIVIGLVASHFLGGGGGAC
ncbi:membrane protein YqaA with SNARE-associated domain [Caulobacter ginsengisoli]|uniref:Membrane protein YqaA with SNARE-associated domain n=1 Tax=Caulobacter ginsengisoli TaxID=400775 RepID=A0ABU0IXS8_9CAUL|nr:YqaA family protein [Caulobacter ginsengisoli]MDQ0465854.1 membrane protein YqaA with SNARE-associated domain [Caulobacter ginsengisoli]